MGTKANMAMYAPDLLVCPVTAVGYSPPECSVALAFVAQGPILRAYERQGYKLCWVSQVFEAQEIHGVAFKCFPQENSPLYWLRCVIWGGRSTRILHVHFHRSGAVNQADFDFHGDELRINDRILHAALSPTSVHAEEVQGRSVLAALLTAHNELHLVMASYDCGSLSLFSQDCVHGSSIALYSAFSLWESNGVVTVVAGTVFGAVHVWKTNLDAHGTCSEMKPSYRLIRVLKGHEGSVYGVGISSFSQKDKSAIVASCSDDRTVRAWKVTSEVDELSRQDQKDHFTEGSWPDIVTGFDFSDVDSQGNRRAVAYPSSHLSRIWFALPIVLASNKYRFLSAGEDGAIYLWSVVDRQRHPIKKDELPLLPVASFKRHDGRNVWSVDQHIEESNSQHDSISILTGGADGKVIHQSVTFQGVEEAHLTENTSYYGQINNSSIVDSFVIRSLFTYGGINPENECFRAHTFIDNGQILASTRLGHVFLGKIVTKKPFSDIASFHAQVTSVEWQSRQYAPNLQAPTKITRVPGYGAILVGKQGELYVWKSEDSNLMSLAEMPGGVSAVIPIDIAAPASHVSTVIVGYHGGQEAHLIEWHHNSHELIAEPTRVEIPRGFQITAATWVHGLETIALGSRNGKILLYKFTGTSRSGSIKLHYASSQLHGNNTITQLLDLGLDTSRSGSPTFLMSTGRDGNLQIYSIRALPEAEDEIDFRIVHQVKMPLGPDLEGAYIDRISKEVLLWGFKSTDFVLWNYTAQTEAMKVYCGGGRRIWNFLPTADRPAGGHFVWTRASSSFVYAQNQPSHRIIQNGSHGREINTIAIRPNERTAPQSFIATGAEDTSIRIAELKYGVEQDPHGGTSFQTYCIVPYHQTGVGQLHWSNDGRYLFSSGGAEQLLAWRVQNVPFVKIGIVLVAECPIVSRDGDLRVMDFSIYQLPNEEDAFLIAAVYSDSTLRLWYVNCLAQKATSFRLAAMGTYGSNCLNQTRYLQVGSKTTLLTTSTDGHIAVWDIHPESMAQETFSVSHPGTLTVKETYRIHQSSIKSLEMIELHSSLNTTLIATGGDDNSVALTVCGHDKDTLALSTLLLLNAHAAAVSGVVWLPAENLTVPRLPQEGESRNIEKHILISGSNDQTIRSWEITINSDALLLSSGIAKFLQVRKLRKCHSSIADISSIALMSRADGDKIIVVGVGIEIWDVAKLMRERSTDGIS